MLKLNGLRPARPILYANRFTVARELSPVDVSEQSSGNDDDQGNAAELPVAPPITINPQKLSEGYGRERF
jgi:hypothetical protein